MSAQKRINVLLNQILAVDGVQASPVAAHLAGIPTAPPDAIFLTKVGPFARNAIFELSTPLFPMSKATCAVFGIRLQSLELPFKLLNNL
jgi:hypothetical protein